MYGNADELTINDFSSRDVHRREARNHRDARRSGIRKLLCLPYARQLIIFTRSAAVSDIHINRNERYLMKRTLSMVAMLLTIVSLASLDVRAEETIVFFRHAEKPAGGYGQLTCQGLNRSIELADVLINRFGPANWGYAPNPAVTVSDPAGSFYYVRPLATLEPAAIRSGISVNTHYAYTDISGLRSVLIRSSKANDTIFVAWEHTYLVKAVQSIMNAYGGGPTVPAWPSGDYDALYIVHVTYTSSGIQAWFEVGQEGLNGRPTTCP